MRTLFTLKNYRCFVAPATVELSKGFTAFVGINNAGKSAFMRCLLEFRRLFRILCDRGPLFRSLGGGIQLDSILHVLDPLEAFSNLNDRPIEFAFECERGV